MELLQLHVNEVILERFISCQHPKSARMPFGYTFLKIIYFLSVYYHTKF
jgi:hypothetical protein